MTTALIGIIIGLVILCVVLKGVTAEQLASLKEGLDAAIREEQKTAGLRRQVEGTLAALQVREHDLQIDGKRLRGNLEEATQVRAALEERAEKSSRATEEQGEATEGEESA